MRFVKKEKRVKGNIFKKEREYESLLKLTTILFQVSADIGQ